MTQMSISFKQKATCCCVAAAKSLQSCLTLCYPIDGSPPGSPHPWDSPGKSTGVGCHFLLQHRKVKNESEVAQSRPTLSDPMDCSLPGSSVQGIFQARVLEWGAIAFSKKKKKDIQIYKADLCLPRGWGDAGRKHQEFGIRHYKRLRRWWMNEARNYKSKWNRRGSLGSCCTPHSVNVTDCFLSKLQENLSNIFLSRLPILKLFLI